MKAAPIEDEVLSLPLAQRASLARRLLASLDHVDGEEFDRLCGVESALRR